VADDPQVASSLNQNRAGFSSEPTPLVKRTVVSWLVSQLE